VGFEVNYNYYEKLENSFDYNREEPKTLRKIYGKAVEEYPVEKLAQAIMQQMARRDIFIFDLEIFEFQKKKISFRQNKGDLVIKNKKFTSKGELLVDIEEDNCPDGTCHLPPVVQPQPAVNIAPPIQQQNVNIAPSIQQQNVNIAPSIQQQNVNIAPRPSGLVDRILKRMQFLPGRVISPIGAFTVEKYYPVYRESLAKNGIGMMIETTDDRGRRVTVSDEHFVTASQSLLGEDATEPNFVNDNKLNWGGVVKDSVPKIR
jgi:hypothetical protein